MGLVAIQTGSRRKGGMDGRADGILMAAGAEIWDGYDQQSLGVRSVGRMTTEALSFLGGRMHMTLAR